MFLDKIIQIFFCSDFTAKKIVIKKFKNSFGTLKKKIRETNSYFWKKIKLFQNLIKIHEVLNKLQQKSAKI